MHSQSLKDQVLAWLALGGHGVSAEAMARAVIGMKPEEPWSLYGDHPSDPADFKRCVDFLVAVPEAKKHLELVASLSKVWSALIENWTELEKIFKEETSTGSGRSKKLYARMKALGC